MKTNRNLVSGLIACAVALALTSVATAQTMGKAKVVRIKGSARFNMAGSPWQPLKVGDVIKPGATIQTSKDKGDYVDLVLGDGTGSVASSIPNSAPTSATPISYQPKTEQNFVRVYENSILGIDKLSSMDTGADTVSETQLDLKAGHIMGSVKKMSAASKYEVKIPNGVAGIRGTIYELHASGVVKVAEGSVVIAYVGADGQVVTQVVNAGQEFDARTGEIKPLPPGEVNSIIRTAGQGRPGVFTTGTTFTTDHTVFFVSPTQGDQGNQNQNGQGDNPQGPSIRTTGSK